MEASLIGLKRVGRSTRVSIGKLPSRICVGDAGKNGAPAISTKSELDEEAYDCTVQVVTSILILLVCISLVAPSGLTSDGYTPGG